MEDNIEDNPISHFTAPSAEENVIKETTINSEDINAAIAMADDGKTIILCDYKFVKAPDMIVLDMYSMRIHITGGDFGYPGVYLQYPLEYDKINIWKNEGVTYFAHVDDNGAHNTYEVPILFTNEE